MRMIGDLLGEEGPLGFVGGEVERLPVGAGRLAGPADPAEQVGFDRGQVVISRQTSVAFELLDQKMERFEGSMTARLERLDRKLDQVIDGQSRASRRRRLVLERCDRGLQHVPPGRPGPQAADDHVVGGGQRGPVP